MKTIFFLTLNLVMLTSVCQVPASELNIQDKKFFQTLTTAAEYLKTHKTIPLAFHKSSTYTKEESFYDEVINKYFEKNKTRQLLVQDTSILGLEGKMGWMRHILNEADYYLDIIPSDSIFVRHYNSEELPNTLEIYFIVNNKDIRMYLFHFDSLSGLLVNLSIGAIPGTEEFISYLRRQKNYYEFPNPFRKN